MCVFPYEDSPDEAPIAKAYLPAPPATADPPTTCDKECMAFFHGTWDDFWNEKDRCVLTVFNNEVLEPCDGFLMP